RRELVELKNQAESAAYQSEKTLKENREKISDEHAKSLEEAIAEVNKLREGTDAAALKTAMDAMQQVTFKIAEELYKSGATADAGATGAGPEAGEPAAAPGE